MDPVDVVEAALGSLLPKKKKKIGYPNRAKNRRKNKLAKKARKTQRKRKK